MTDNDASHDRAGRYHHGNLRMALLAAARRLLEEAGPSALNLREIARRAAVAAPSAYHHFTSREAMAVELVAEGFRDLAAALGAITPDPAGRLRTVGQAYIGFARSNPGLYRLMFGEGFATASAALAETRALRREAFGIVKAGLARRLPADRVDAAALFLWSLVHGLALLIIDGQVPEGADIDAMVDNVLALSATGVPRAEAAQETGTKR